MADLSTNTQANLSTSVEKAREAQKKFEETKVKVEEAKAKAEEAVRKAKALEQQVRALQALRSTPGGVKGGIAAIVATQVGSLRGKLVSQIQGRVVELVSRFLDKCPTPSELQKVIKIRNNLLKVLNSFQKRLDQFSSTANTLTSTVSAISLVIKVITSIPIPTSVPPGVGLPVSLLTKYSNALIKLNKRLDTLTAEALAITSMVSSAKPLLDTLQGKLLSLDALIEQCSLDPSTDIASILSTVQPKENTGSEGIPSADYQYKGYTLAIVQDLSASKIAPKRYATATDSRGIVVLRGPLSFSSSTQVLLDEIKFRIDNKLA